MLERQDIDALLVGALYGELSSAEQAQLTAHLESHPADRNALDDLKAVRERFTSSRIFEVQLDPPQSVSALLLQEAARRAPKLVVAPDKKESWFDRFVRSFIAHPAMAAAATLVLVVGVAGTIYLKGGEAQQPRVGQPASDTVAEMTPSAGARGDEGAWGSATMGAMDPGAGDYKRNSVAVGLAEDKVAKTGRDRSEALGFADDGKQEGAKHAAAGSSELAKPSPSKAPKSRYVEVPKESPQPKDLDDEQQDSAGKDLVAKNDRKEATRAASAGAAGGGAANAASPRGPATAPDSNFANAPAANIAQQSRAAAPPPPPQVAAEPPAAKAVAKPDASLAWAKDQHARIIALVKDGKCSAAVPLAATLKTRAPDYYATNVATDRSLKSCMQYVNDTANERAAEKKASKAVDTR